MEDIFAKIGLHLSHFIVGVLAGGIGMIFNKKPRTKRERLKAFFTLVAGTILTGVITPLIILWQPWMEGAAYGVAFIIGILGMGVIEATISFLREFKKDPIGTIKKVKGYDKD